MVTTRSSMDGAYDVVVAGGGGAGLMAAIEAAGAGAKVLLVEKQPELGGATGMSIGSITAAGTALQRAAGIEDTVEAHYRDLLKGIEAAAATGQEYDRDLSRLMCEVAPGALERLMGLGLEFSGPHPEPPNSVYRMHNVKPDAGAYIDVLGRVARERGVTVRTSTTVRELHCAENGAVVGLTVAGESGAAPVRAGRGVVLAAGDFSANDELARAHGRTPELSAVEPIRPYATGEGILVAMAIGAAAVGLHRSGGAGFRTVARPYIAPERGLLVAGGVLVNREGRRFCNELRNAALAANTQPGKLAWLVFDARLAAQIATAADDRSPSSRDGWSKQGKLFASTFPGAGYAYLDDLRRTSYFCEAGSLTELASEIGLPVGHFNESIEEWNELTVGSTDAFGREKPLAGVSQPPFFAIGPIKPYNVFSGGGLAVDRDMRVLREDGSPIAGLFAAGANAEAGVYLGGHGHHLAWVFGTGQIAGRNAARRIPA